MTLHVGAGINIPAEGLTLWLSADQNVTIVSGLVSSWGHLLNPGFIRAEQATSGARPTITNNAINGHPSVTFNGVSQFLSIGGSSNNPILDASSFTVFSLQSNGNTLWCRGRDSAGRGWSARDREFITTIPHTTYRSVSNIPTASGYRLVVTRFTQNGSYDMWVNDTKASGNTSPGSELRSSSVWLDLGLAGRNTFFVEGAIAEILIYAKALSDEEMIQVKRYFYGKYLPGYADFISIGNNVTVSGNGAGDYVAIIDATTKELVRLVELGGVADWSDSIPEGEYYMTYFAEGCQPITHGPHTITAS